MKTLNEPLEEIWGEEPGLGTWLSTIDHKRIAKKYLYTALVFLVLGGINCVRPRAHQPDSRCQGRYAPLRGGRGPSARGPSLTAGPGLAGRGALRARLRPALTSAAAGGARACVTRCDD